MSAAVCGVEVAGRLVADQQRRIGGERAGDRDALLLAARELGRKVVGLVGEARRARGCAARSRAARAWAHGARSPAAASRSRVPSASGSSWKNWKTTPTRRPRQIGELLLAHLVDPAAVDRDRSGGRAVDAGDHVHDRRLAAARRPDDGDHVAARRSSGRRRAARGRTPCRSGRPSRRRPARSSGGCTERCRSLCSGQDL